MSATATTHGERGDSRSPTTEPVGFRILAWGLLRRGPRPSLLWRCSAAPTPFPVSGAEILLWILLVAATSLVPLTSEGGPSLVMDLPVLSGCRFRLWPRVRWVDWADWLHRLARDATGSLGLSCSPQQGADCAQRHGRRSGLSRSQRTAWGLARCGVWWFGGAGRRLSCELHDRRFGELPAESPSGAFGVARDATRLSIDVHCRLRMFRLSRGASGRVLCSAGLRRRRGLRCSDSPRSASLRALEAARRSEGVDSGEERCFAVGGRTDSG